MSKQKKQNPQAHKGSRVVMGWSTELAEGVTTARVWHGLGTRNIVGVFFRSADGRFFSADSEIVGEYTLLVRFSVPIPAGVVVNILYFKEEA